MLLRLLATLGLALAFLASQASAQSLTTYTFATLPGSPAGGQLAWITDNSGTPTVGSPAAGGAAAENRDLVSWDATETRWEFVARQPTAGPAVPVSTLMDAVRIAYANGTSGAASANVQSAIDELFAPRNFVQPTPTVLQDKTTTIATITNPASTVFGFGLTFDNPSTFTAETYPGSGVTGNEADNQIGIFYNKTGVGSSGILNVCEYAMDDSWELSYRANPGTGSKTWLEKNWDFVPPVLRSTVTGAAGFNPAVGSWITFPNNFSGKVVAWNSGTGVLDWVQNFGCPSAGQVVTGTGGSKTLGAISHIGYTYAVRPFQMEWDTVDGTAGFHLRTDTVAKQPADPFRITGSGLVGINALNTPVGHIYAETKDATPASAVAFVASASDGVSGGVVRVGQRILTDYTSVQNVDNVYGEVNMLEAVTPTGAIANLFTIENVVYRSSLLNIKDQKGAGYLDSAAIRIAAQTCPLCSFSKASEHGNVELQGGNWNNGHLVLGGYGGAFSGSGDHLWADQTNNRLRFKAGASGASNAPTSETDGSLLTQVVASGTRAMATSAIGAGACNTADVNITATGVVSTDVVKFSPNADPGLNAGLLVYSAYAGSGVISFRVCNPSAGSLTPAAVTMNWRVDR